MPPDPFALVIFQRGSCIFTQAQPWTIILLPMSPVYLGIKMCLPTCGLFIEMRSH
jgi:hypothetical protein